jgi:hypothetical protein
MRLLMSFFALTVFCGGTAEADFIYSLQIAPASQVIAPNATTSVQVFLVESGTAGGGQVSMATNGLTAALVKLNWDTGGAAVLNNSDVVGGTGFVQLTPGTTDTVNRVASLTQQVSFAAFGVTGTSVLLGTFTFTAPNANDTVTNLTASQFNPTPGSDDFVLANGQVLDGITANGFASISTTVTAVPEPSSVALVGLCLAGAACQKRFFKKRVTQV